MRKNELFVCYKLGNLAGFKNIYSRAFPDKREEFETEFKNQAEPLWNRLDIEEELRDEDRVVISLTAKSFYHANSYMLGLYSYGIFTSKNKDNPYARKVKEIAGELKMDEGVVDCFYDMEDSSLEEKILYYSTTIRIALEKLEKEI